ncbi:hypothetical protein SAMN02799636_04972 [Methylobacterium sp. 275MFSha3.1]|uniref:hypothetical protein n=1 Tax=Methylobacterium sp. 275MFSha3.1 TaxID=1502746 RepID=UPI0008A79FF3|nr:hypothetical protein [Methylobacterium sp. 275MFSha3.1]SEI01875.1 hypothetical protein SAMN02799636_04972 [Methylobacterium sp. 275MFSha3.1]
MGQRMRPTLSSVSEQVREDVEDCGSPWSRPFGATRLVSQIAEALHVPPAELYNLPTAVMPVHKTDGDDILGRDCEALLHVYRRILDPDKRQQLLALVLEVANQS